MAFQAGPADGVARAASCGLGLPPNDPRHAGQDVVQLAESRTKGFMQVCEENLERYSMTFVPMALATMGLDFTLINLDRTPFARLNAIGGRPESVNGMTSRFYRGFRTLEGHTVTLFEHDMSADGTSMWRSPKDELERVNGLPASFVVLEARPDRAVSVLSWLQGRRYYEIWLDANAAREPLRARLFDLASSLPVSTPACAEEQPPKPARLDADGFPVIEPPPLILTSDDLEAISQKSACR